MSETVQERWDRIGNTLFGGTDPTDPTSATETGGLGLCVVRQQELAARLVDRNFNVLAHRWYHTIGSPQLNLMTFIFSQIPGGVEVAVHRMAEDMFHLGFLAGAASADDEYLDTELADSDDAAICVDTVDGGVRTIAQLQEVGIIPPFTDDQLEHITRMRDAIANLVLSAELTFEDDDFEDERL